jgi:NitT/TauT family transport system permease protein
MLRIVVLPAVFSWVFAAFKLSVGYAMIGAILGEFVGATSGLGYQLTQAQGLLDTDRVFSIVVVTGVLAAIVLWLAQRLENAVLKWRPQVQLA